MKKILQKALKFFNWCIEGVTWRQVLLILLGTAVTSFGIHNIHQQTGVTEGGVIGLILLANHWLGWSPAILSPLLDAACYALAFRQLGGGFIRLSIFSSVALAGFFRLWELFPPLLPDLSSLPLLAAVAGGLFVGVGVGLVIWQGGSCGGDDALALTISGVTGWRISKAYLTTDLTVLVLSLTYIPLTRIVFSLLTVIISSLLIDFIQTMQWSRSEPVKDLPEEPKTISSIDIPPVTD